MRSHSVQVAHGFVLLEMVAAACLGCGGPEVGIVRGKVTLDGKPLPSGTVTMAGGPAGLSLMAPIQPDGTFAMRTHDADGLPPGTYKVAVSAQQIAEGDLVVLATDVQKPRTKSVDIPAKYRSVDTSGLTAEVKAGDNPPFDFELK